METTSNCSLPIVESCLIRNATILYRIDFCIFLSHFLVTLHTILSLYVFISYHVTLLCNTGQTAKNPKNNTYYCKRTGTSTSACIIM